MNIFKNIMLVLLGMVFAVAIFSIAVGIGCAVNGITFGEQIAQWFGNSKPAIDATKEIAETVSAKFIA